MTAARKRRPAPRDAFRGGRLIRRRETRPSSTSRHASASISGAVARGQRAAVHLQQPAALGELSRERRALEHRLRALRVRDDRLQTLRLHPLADRDQQLLRAGERDLDQDGIRALERVAAQVLLEQRRRGVSSNPSRSSSPACSAMSAKFARTAARAPRVSVRCGQTCGVAIEDRRPVRGGLDGRDRGPRRRAALRRHPKARHASGRRRRSPYREGTPRAVLSTRRGRARGPARPAGALEARVTRAGAPARG